MQSETETEREAPAGRPFVLDSLYRPLQTLPGIGPRQGKLFEKLTGGARIADILFHLPVDFVDRRFSPKIADAPPGRIATLTVRVEKHKPSSKRHLPYRVTVADGTGHIDLVFFSVKGDYLEKTLPLGATVVVSGKVEFYQGLPQMSHPDFIGSQEEFEHVAAVEPIYPLTAGLTNRAVRKAIAAALERLPDLPEWQDAAWYQRQGWPSWREAMIAVHNPAGETGLSPEHPARQRLAYDEFLSNQLALALVRHRQRHVNGRILKAPGILRQTLLDALPFRLTGAQERAVADIDADMAQPIKMLRLLQGDVGSGKTIVAALAMLNAVECGTQAALMAPTEILARQHAESLRPLLDAAGISMAVLTGRNKGKARASILAEIAEGKAQIVIGTHALFQDDVAFHDLGLAVIDEQHRFGVHQRLQISAKGRGTDVLVMTATPIPRTLTLTAYGDMDVSRLDEKPPGRKPVDTRLIPNEKIMDVIEGLRRGMETGARVYWVCPLVEESEILDLAAAQERFEVLEKFFPGRVGLIHGKMKPDEKDRVMAAFIAGELSLLVATTVIEVGVNVPEATVMIIEHAERFGLAQLHQLRGRVGRGQDQSFCFLLYAIPTGATARERLQTMRDTEDGFIIAEKDLQLRGGGEVLGTRQSGLPEFRLGNLTAHGDLLAAARDDARLIIERDPALQSPRGQALRVLLYLFGRDQAVRYLKAG